MSRRDSRKNKERRLQVGVEGLEGRSLMTGPGAINFQAAFGLGSVGQYSSIRSNAVATDAAGDTYLTGSFKIKAGFDPNNPNATLTTSNTQDTFVAKYSPAGALLWVDTFVGHATTTGGTTTYATSQGSAIAVDASGSVFVAGGFSGTVDFGTGSNLSQRTNAGGTVAYAAKLNPSGNLVWVQTSGGSVGDTDQAYALTLDGSGGVVIAGSYAETATFGTTTLTSGGLSEAFAADIGSAGQYNWAISTHGGSSSNAQVNGVAVDAAGNVALAGFYSGSVNFDPGTGSTVLNSPGTVSAAVWKLTPAGKLLWARSYGNTNYDAASGVAVDSLGNVYATGTFSGTVAFGAGGSGDSLTAGPIFDAFVVKLDQNGNEAWAKGYVGPNGYAKGQGIAVDGAGNVHVAGVFSATVDFDPGAGVANLTSLGSTAAFAAGLDFNGNYAYALAGGGSGFNAALGVAIDAAGSVALTGTYTGSATFGPLNVAAVGVTSVFAAGYAVTVQPPALAAPLLEAGSTTGTNNTTSVNSPILDVAGAVATDTVELLRDGVVVGQRVGPGPIRDVGPVPDGAHLYTTLQLAPTGLAGPSSPATTVTILTKPPAAPSAPQLLAADDSGTVGDGITNVVSPRLTGTGPPSVTIQLLNAAGAVVGTTTTNASRAFTVQPSAPLANGTYALRARAIDAANNVGAAGPAFALTILAETLATPGPIQLLAADDSGAPGDGITNVRSPRVTGTAPAGMTVQVITSNGVVLATTTATASGTYAVALAGPLNQGTYSLSAVASDAAGNLSQAGPVFSLTILTTPPAAPGKLTLLPADDSGTLGDGITNVNTPRLTGNGPAGTTIQVVDAMGNVDATATVAANGTFTATISPALKDGTYSLQARAIDVAGNVGTPGPAMTLTIMTTPPAAPSAPTLLASDDSGLVGDGITNVRSPRVNGTAPAGTTVQVLTSAGVILATTTATAGGAYLVALAGPLAQGSYLLHAVATDVAGNVSPSSGTSNLTILTTPPATPSAPALLAADDSGAPGDGITNVRSPRITVNEPGSGLTVELINAANVVVAQASSSVNGLYTIMIPGPLADGRYPLRAVAVDAAGNAGAAGPAFNLQVLTATPPTPKAPGLLAADDTNYLGDGITSVVRPRIVGTAVPGNRVDWLNAAGALVATTTASAVDGSYVLQPALSFPNASMTVQVRQADAAGNISALSPAFKLTIRATVGDYFGNGVSDVGTFSTSLSQFNILNPTNYSLYRQTQGMSGDVPIQGDFFGDGRGDVATYHPATATFTVTEANSTNTMVDQWGAFGDIPVPANYDGLGKADVAVFRPSTQTFFIRYAGGYLARQWGAPGDIPVPADYFGTGHADIAVFRPSTATFFILDLITGNYQGLQWGAPGDVPVPADYEGNGRADIAVFRPSNDTFYIHLTNGGFYGRSFGNPGDVPVMGDYFGQGRATLAVYRSSTSTFYGSDMITGALLVQQWGAPNTDKPLLAPINSWFNAGGGTNAIVFGPPVAPPSFVIPLVVAVDPTLVLPAVVPSRMPRLVLLTSATSR